MTKREELEALAERVERAEGADRTLDAAVGEIVLGSYLAFIKAQCPAYTTSLDAAMGLVPEGWGDLHFGALDDGKVLCEIIYDAPDRATEMGVAATMPLALVVTALRARAVVAALRARAAGEG